MNWQKIRTQPFVIESKVALNRFKRYAPIVSFVAGFSWDTLTLGRIDRLLDNVILLSYVLLLGVFILLQNLTDKNILKKPFWYRYKDGYPLIIQFLFGGLFSAYVIFYSQSAAFTKTDIFLVLLVILLLGNEFLRERLTNLYFQMTLYFLVLFAFLTFFIPVVSKMMNRFIFIGGGLVSLAVVLGMLYWLFRKSAISSRENFRRANIAVISVYIVANLFYFFNWIPPVPLSLKYGSICHTVEKVGDQYLLRYEKPDWYFFWDNYNTEYHYLPDDTVYCFASVFAPTALNTAIFHHWQMWDAGREEWQTTDRMQYKITGGRDGGYRGFTLKKNVVPGDWRVDVETRDGKLLSRMKFTIVPVDSLPHPLREKYK